MHSSLALWQGTTCPDGKDSDEDGNGARWVDLSIQPPSECQTVKCVLASGAAPDVGWSGCDLNGANLDDADLAGANRSNASLEGTSLL
jgi:uncharacterized protein YjbI with pentapeptide repeats